MISVQYDDHQSLLAPDPPKLPCLQAHTHGQLGPASQATTDAACGNQSGNFQAWDNGNNNNNNGKMVAGLRPD